MFFPCIAMRTTMGNLYTYATFDKTLFYGDERRKATAERRGWGGAGRVKDTAAVGLRSTGMWIFLETEAVSNEFILKKRKWFLSFGRILSEEVNEWQTKKRHSIMRDESLDSRVSLKKSGRGCRGSRLISVQWMRD